MVRESLDGSLRHLTEVGALAVAAGALALLVVAFLAEVLRRVGRAPRLVAQLDRVLPRRARAIAAGALALAAALPLGGTASADDSVRAWLSGAGGPSTTTTPTTTGAPPTTAPVATHGSVDARAGAPVPDPGVVASPAVPPPEPVADDAPSPSPLPSSADHHVVAPGECLWAIAQERLGPSATNQAIDAGWRAIYAANRAAIGDDPGLIHPGLVLALPPLVPNP
jgi:nucleoid-associated protein YgaU